MIMIIDRVGLDKVVEDMCRPRGLMRAQFDRTGGYIVREDDLRRCVNDLYSSMRHNDSKSKTLRS